MQPTTALRKISGLRKKIWGIQGGQGAGKTYSILLLIINHASSQPNKEIYIASAELSKMRITVIKDAVNILNRLNLKVEVTGTKNGSPVIIFQNKSFIQFVGLDKEDLGKGLRSDIIFVNEANKVSFEAYRELTSRAKRVIIDFNPNKKFWFHSEIMPREDCEFLKLTYIDNEFLSDEEKHEILLYKEKGYDAEGNVINQYWANMWRVYGLGEVGQVEGRIYNWKPIPYNIFREINKESYYGCDWGKVDPFAVVEVKYHDGDLYVNELHYKSENEIERELSPEQLKQIKSHDNESFEGLVGWVFKNCNVDKNAMVVCDSNRPNKIRSLRRSGWEYAVSVGRKLTLEERVSILSGLNIYYTDSSKNIEMEQEAYCYDKDRNGVLIEKPIDQDNHLLDAITYAVQKMFSEGIIKAI